MATKETDVQPVPDLSHKLISRSNITLLHYIT